MDQVREFIGLFLILAFTAMLPGVVNTCPNCIGTDLPTAILATSVSVFSGTIDSAQVRQASSNGTDTTLHTYDVTAKATWIGLGKQSAQLSLPRIKSPAGCASISGQPNRTTLFLVVGAKNQNPLFWFCLPSFGR